MKSDALVIIPAYNEEGPIQGVINSIKALYPEMDILVIDDGSSDDTASIAEASGAVCITHPFNMGYGVALQTGYKYALMHEYKYVVQMDADGQHDAGGIKILLDTIREGSCDVVLGSRFMGAGDYKMSFARLIGVKFFRLVLRILSGRNIADPTTGFQAITRKVVRIFSHDMFPYDYPDADMIILLSKVGCTIIERPLSMHPNKTGKSMHKGAMKALYYIFTMLLSMAMTRLRTHRIDEIFSANGGIENGK